MKNLFFSCVFCGLFAGTCLGGLRETFKSTFRSVTAKDDGVFIELSEYRRSDPSAFPVAYPVNRNEKEMIIDKDLGECFIPYGFAKCVVLSDRYYGLSFDPLKQNDSRKGFRVHWDHKQPPGRVRLEGTLLYLKNPDSDGCTYEIVDEIMYVQDFGDGIGATNVYVGAEIPAVRGFDLTSVPVAHDNPQVAAIFTNFSDAERMRDYTPPSEEWIQRHLKRIRAEANPIEPKSETSKNSIQFPWRVILPVLGMLLVVIGLVVKKITGGLGPGHR
jgi:hypothetical protein